MLATGAELYWNSAKKKSVASLFSAFCLCKAMPMYTVLYIQEFKVTPIIWAKFISEI
jgi:hypothetical protein